MPAITIINMNTKFFALVSTALTFCGCDSKNAKIKPNDSYQSATSGSTSENAADAGKIFSKDTKNDMTLSEWYLIQEMSIKILEPILEKKIGSITKTNFTPEDIIEIQRESVRLIIGNGDPDARSKMVLKNWHGSQIEATNCIRRRLGESEFKPIEGQDLIQILSTQANEIAKLKSVK